MYACYLCVCAQCNGAILFEWLSLCLEFAKSVSEWACVCLSMCGCKQKSNNYIEWPMAGKEAAAASSSCCSYCYIGFYCFDYCLQTRQSEEYIVTPSRSAHPRLLYTRLRSDNINNVLFCLCFGFFIWQWRLSLPCACIIYVKLYLLLYVQWEILHLHRVDDDDDSNWSFYAPRIAVVALSLSSSLASSLACFCSLCLLWRYISLLDGRYGVPFPRALFSACLCVWVSRKLCVALRLLLLLLFLLLMLFLLLYQLVIDALKFFVLLRCCCCFCCCCVVIIMHYNKLQLSLSQLLNA